MFKAKLVFMLCVVSFLTPAFAEEGLSPEQRTALEQLKADAESVASQATPEQKAVLNREITNEEAQKISQKARFLKQQSEKQTETLDSI